MPIGMQYRKTTYAANEFDTYWFEKNLQGDVVQLRSIWGTLLAEYDYDAWGNCTVVYQHPSYGDLANLNPIRYRGYFYDFETGFYYLNSRYYDPQVKRFINADDASLLGANNNFISLNLYSYCGNNPIVRKDISGDVWETVFDIISLGASIAEVAVAPSNIWNWVGLAGDVIDLFPFVTCVGEAAKAFRFTVKVTDDLSDLTKAGTYGIKSYKALRKQLKGTGLQAHHIIEKRLVKYLGIDPDEMLSVAVTTAEHQAFTNAWRKYFKYGTDYRTITKDQIWIAAQEIYKDYPELLEAAKKILFD